MADTREEFSEKVLAKLKEMNKAVDLTEESSIANVEQAVQEIIAEQRQEIISIKSEDFTALGTTTQGGGSGSGPATGGSKDILIIPGFGGTSSDTTSQINFYWDTGFGTSGYTTASGNPPSTNTDTGKRTSIFNYASGTTAPVLVFGGYTGTTYYAPSTSYGGSVNATVANIWINPFTGQIDTNYINFNNGVATSTTQGVISWSTTDARLAIGTGTVTKFLAYTTDVTSANQITATTDGADVDMYALFVNNLGDGSTNQTVSDEHSPYHPYPSMPHEYTDHSTSPDPAQSPTSAPSN